MANKTLLNSVNEVLKRVGVIAGDAGALSSLTDSARQVFIDTAVQVINEGITDIYATSGIAHPNEQAESTMTLVTATRAYTLASDLVQLRFPMRDKTNNQRIYEYPGGYNAMLDGDPEQDDTGLPMYGAFRATDGKFHLDRAPTSVENGRVYTYQYDKSLLLTAAANTVPFNDTVWTKMVPVWSQLWRRDRQNSFDAAIYKTNLGIAAGYLSQKQPRDNYLNR